MYIVWSLGYRHRGTLGTCGLADSFLHLFLEMKMNEKKVRLTKR